MEVPLRPCALNSSLAASSRRERILWRGVGDPAACAREALRARAPGMPLPSSLTLAKRALRFPSDLVCIAYKQDRSKRFFWRRGTGTTFALNRIVSARRDLIR